MDTTWDPAATGVLRLPSGRLVRGRGLRDGLPAGPKPDFALHLRGRRPPETEWESRWLRWPDFWLPTDRAGFEAALREALQRSATERVEIACGGGFGRTGTALACLVAMDGPSEHDPISYVRENYSKRAVETPWQKRFVGRFS
ncbi:protein phosphatase [Saccharopolyspora sp. HNM0986]|uniref:protein-tyrosine phosphatase family protein n=1 Tax=Saccharopolyspora galaxeae TaxID=2781241 RepID=UPI00190AF2C8|nr:protein-tyrosine phosphatase family protein [Saccharopolyspora sp. HNM0986]MBK0870629.1 protein phosphatase [Saccharopolyspora sp. HNM0986]